jgi:hypothetical protein
MRYPVYPDGQECQGALRGTIKPRSPGADLAINMGMLEVDGRQRRNIVRVAPDESLPSQLSEMGSAA